MTSLRLRSYNYYVLLLLLVYSSTTLAQSDRSESKSRLMKRIYQTQQIVSEPPNIDGKLDDRCWDEGVWSGNYLQWMPVEGAKPTAETELKILYDNDNIYVAIRAHDDPNKIDRLLGRRDNFDGDVVGVCFDSYFDHRTGFEFDLTAAGSKIDNLLMNFSWDTNWTAVWDGKVALEDSAWTAEMRIPLSQLRYANKDEQVWGLHAWRWINRNQEEDQWNLIPRDHIGYLHSIGELHGIKGIEAKRRIELLPYSVGKIERNPKPENIFEAGNQNNMAIGLDGKIGLSSNFTMDFTINPDFGQVEADPSVLNLTVFETFYDEKRPFFLEGRNILDFEIGDNQLFYSRRIGQNPVVPPGMMFGEGGLVPDESTILGAMKVTGKTENGISVGILESVTSTKSYNIGEREHPDERVTEPVTNHFIGRIQKDINEGNTVIGGMATATNRRIKNWSMSYIPDAAYTGGVDFSHHWNDKTYYVDVKTIFSRVQGEHYAIYQLQNASSRYFQRPDAGHIELNSSRTQLSGHGGHIELGKRSNGNWRFHLTTNWSSPGLELNDLGYMTRTDYIVPSFSVGYVNNQPRGIIRESSIYAGSDLQWTFGKEYLGESVFTEAYVKYANKWENSLRITRTGDGPDLYLLRGGPSIYMTGNWNMFYHFSTDYSKRFNYYMDYSYNYNDDNISYVHSFAPGFGFKVMNSVRFFTDLAISHNREMLHYLDVINPTEDERLFMLGQLDQRTLGITFRMDMALSPDFTIQYYGSPYVSIGEYSHFTYIADETAHEYTSLLHEYTDSELAYHADDNCYYFTIYSNGQRLANPNFNFREFRSNLVARWEYQPGSTLYLVWTHGRSFHESARNYSIRTNMDALWDISPTNVFLIKWSYWLGM
ncbi:carbohydrate binding family 9 domain-containing protein [candidate division KSB1 bacterium]|nr:carbohydrate binding family 9 domain-containing protein [candidate division KSB1 bacterium]